MKQTILRPATHNTLEIVTFLWTHVSRPLCVLKINSRPLRRRPRGAGRRRWCTSAPRATRHIIPGAFKESGPSLPFLGRVQHIYISDSDREDGGVNFSKEMKFVMKFEEPSLFQEGKETHHSVEHPVFDNPVCVGKYVRFVFKQTGRRSRARFARVCSSSTASRCGCSSPRARAQAGSRRPRAQRRSPLCPAHSTGTIFANSTSRV